MPGRKKELLREHTVRVLAGVEAQASAVAEESNRPGDAIRTGWPSPSEMTPREGRRARSEEATKRRALRRYWRWLAARKRRARTAEHKEEERRSTRKRGEQDKVGEEDKGVTSLPYPRSGREPLRALNPQ